MPESAGGSSASLNQLPAASFTQTLRVFALFVAVTVYVAGKVVPLVQEHPPITVLFS